MCMSTSVHEAFPGHFTQYLWEQRAPSRLRRVLAANTNVEGWAHYSEQMMLDEDYAQPGAGAKDLRESRLIHLGQLQKFKLDQSREFFVKEGFQSPKGKLQIMKLRDDVRKKQSAALGKFHDDFMSQGYPPIAIVRCALLGDDSPTL